MASKGYKNHVYIPNSVPEVQEEMLKEIGVKSLEDLHEDIPEELKLKELEKLPEPIESECELKRHMNEILGKNKTCEDNISFLGAGCYHHYVPAVCDEINSRSEFLTAYGGEAYEDHGRFQALFEYQSLMGELLDMDVVNVPTFDYGQAAATAIRMASRITKRYKVIIPKSISPDRFLIIKNYCSPQIELILVDFDKKTGLIDINDLKSKMSNEIAAVYVENPSFLGVIEQDAKTISEITHDFESIFIVGTDPISLGVLEAPANYGADIVCGDLQALGMHMNYGGGQAGFIATRDEEKYVMEYPSRLFGIVPTVVEGEYGFGDVAYERTSFALRENGKEYVGTQAALWGITAGVYLSLLGPNGMYDIGKTIMQKSQYAVHELNKIKGVKGNLFNSSFFKEFVVDFNGTGKTVEEINKALLQRGIFGGLDLSNIFKEFGQCSLYCVTETITKDDIDKLIVAINEIV